MVEGFKPDIQERDWVGEYDKNRDAFLTCSDFIQRHPGLSEQTKTEVLLAFANDLIDPSRVRRGERKSTEPTMRTMAHLQTLPNTYMTGFSVRKAIGEVDSSNQD